MNDWSMIEFEVTQQDIDAGKPGDCLNCPAAIAINRQYPLNDAKWCVCYTEVYPINDIGIPTTPYKWKASVYLEVFQNLFDQNITVYPGMFTIERSV